MKYTDKELKDLYAYRAEIVDVCEKCGGVGYFDEDVTCLCMKVFKYIHKLYIARIPFEYWQLFLNDLNIDSDIKTFFNEKYFPYFKNVVQKNKGIIFAGKNGVGKTALLCEIGKFAISKKYNVMFFSGGEYVQAIHTDDNNFFKKLDIADIHLFDEFGKWYIKEGSNYVLSKVEQYVKKTIAEKVLIVTTNFTKTDLKDMLGDSVMSALQRHCIFMEVHGTDYGVVKQKNWTEDLMSAYNYYHKNILYYTEKFQ